MSNNRLHLAASGKKPFTAKQKKQINARNIDTPDDDGMTLIERAAQSGRIENVKFLLEKHANIDASQKESNLVVLAKDNPDVLNYLSDPAHQIYLCFNDGTTDLHMQALRGDIIAITTATEAKSEDLKKTTLRGESILNWANFGLQHQVIEALLDCNFFADWLDQKDDDNTYYDIGHACDLLGKFYFSQADNDKGHDYTLFAIEFLQKMQQKNAEITIDIARCLLRLGDNYLQNNLLAHALLNYSRIEGLRTQLPLMGQELAEEADELLKEYHHKRQKLQMEHPLISHILLYGFEKKIEQDFTQKDGFFDALRNQLNNIPLYANKNFTAQELLDLGLQYINTHPKEFPGVRLQDIAENNTTDVSLIRALALYFQIPICIIPDSSGNVAIFKSKNPQPNVGFYLGKENGRYVSLKGMVDFKPMLNLQEEIDAVPPCSIEPEEDLIVEQIETLSFRDSEIKDDSSSHYTVDYPDDDEDKPLILTAPETEGHYDDASSVTKVWSTSSNDDDAMSDHTSFKPYPLTRQNALGPEDLALLLMEAGLPQPVPARRADVQAESREELQSIVEARSNPPTFSKDIKEITNEINKIFNLIKKGGGMLFAGIERLGDMLVEPDFPEHVIQMSDLSQSRDDLPSVDNAALAQEEKILRVESEESVDTRKELLASHSRLFGSSDRLARTEFKAALSQSSSNLEANPRESTEVRLSQR